MTNENQDPQGTPKVRRVVAGPVKVDGGLLRLAELTDGSGRVERWDGKAWVPGGGDVSEVMKGAPAAAADLAVYGVPADPPAPMSTEEQLRKLRGIMDGYREGVANLGKDPKDGGGREERERRGEPEQEQDKAKD